jgi:alkylation response protein AidB-like acyl-CoA dehydrogenase
MATHLIISARTSGEQRDKEGITLFLVDKNAEGITTQDYPTIDEYRASEVVLENLKVSKDMVLGEVGKAYDTIDEVVDKATIAVCAEAVGALQVLKDSTIDYCKNRKQFGQPIGKNQSIQHRLVDMMIEYEQSKSILYMACTVDLSDATERRKAVSGAKARIGKAIKFIGENAIQLHGGMGMVDEYMVSHYFKRATMLGILFGNEDYHMKRYSEITQADVIKITDAKASSIAFN